jgi:hypothetical protein
MVNEVFRHNPAIILCRALGGLKTRLITVDADGIRLALIQFKLFARLKSPRPNSVCSSFA